MSFAVKSLFCVNNAKKPNFPLRASRFSLSISSLISFSFSSVAVIIDFEKVNKDNDKLFQQVIENGIISSDDWLEQAKLLASDGAVEDDFGYSVSISGDYAIVGAWGDDDNGVLSGSAYIFKRDDTSWTEQAKLLASDGAACYATETRSEGRREKKSRRFGCFCCDTIGRAANTSLGLSPT